VVPHIGEVKQIHTHKGHSDKPPFLHKASSVKSTTPSPPLFHQEDATENICSLLTKVIVTYNCVFCFSILVSVAP
jgi:hypothetical protein